MGDEGGSVIKIIKFDFYRKILKLKIILYFYISFTCISYIDV